MRFLADFFHYGFWGMALVEFGKFSLLGNVLCSMFIFFYKKEEKNTIKTILAGAAAASLLCAALMSMQVYASAASGPVKISVVITFFIWLGYFIFIPQLIIFFINAECLKIVTANKRVFGVALRTGLTLVLPVGLTIMHAIIGQYIFGITPD